MRTTDRKVLFFIAGTVPTVEEAALIARIEGTVCIRSNLASNLYGTKLETAYALAGTIPVAYKTGNGGTIDAAVFPGGDVTPGVDGSLLTVADGETLEVAAITGGFSHATFTVVGGVVTAIALA